MKSEENLQLPVYYLKGALHKIISILKNVLLTTVPKGKWLVQGLHSY
jgi:hypothetical protein